MRTDELSAGKIVHIAGPVVGASGLENVRLHDVVQVGELRLVGEVIRLEGGVTTIQVYEDTSGVRIGEEVHNTGLPLVAHLGPGLLGSVYDGLQRPLEEVCQQSGDFIQRGISLPALSLEKRWHFTPVVRVGENIFAGDLLGFIPETRSVQHRVLAPPGIRGRVLEVYSGDLRIDEPVVRIELNNGNSPQESYITLAQRWPVRRPRPFQARLDPKEPLPTGMRIIDTFFPVAKGGSAIIPGGFGTGKTVAEQSLARFAAADVVVYVGCGERGNEMTEVLEEFPLLEDPRTGYPLMERTVLIANTSNMPVAAREASIYLGVTIAEYYRDMGYSVLMLADSTSRWGEALREISGRLEEMPGEEGFPAYLAARLAEFYERSGRVVCLGRDLSRPDPPRLTGSVSVVGAVSPPGGDFSEPITQNSMRVTGAFWALDYELSRRRHFPAINWTRSYSLYNFQEWYRQNVEEEWTALNQAAMALLQREVELLEIVQLVGPDALAETERAVLLAARVLREDFLQQSAYHPVDRFCPLIKSFWMLKVIMAFYDCALEALQRKISLDQITGLPVLAEIARMKEIPAEESIDALKSLLSRVQTSFTELGVH